MSNVNNNGSNCILLVWSADAANNIERSFYVCLVALLIHSLFWLSLVAHPSLRQWESMQWLYAFLLIDLLLLARFFLLYGLRSSSACVSTFFYTFVCYFEATGDIYLNFLQGYILLLLNICRHIQITRGGADVYSSHRRLMFATHCFIYLFFLLILIVELVIGWAVLYRRAGGSCDLDYPSLVTRMMNNAIGYICPVILTLLILLLSLRHIRDSVLAMQTQEIIDARLKHHRHLVVQSIIFYSIWLLLWSPHVLICQYVYVSSDVGGLIQLLNYVELTLDPLIVTALDVRFLKAWQKIWRKLKGRVVPEVNQ